VLEGRVCRFWQDRVHEHGDLVVEGFGFIAVIERSICKLKDRTGSFNLFLVFVVVVHFLFSDYSSLMLSCIITICQSNQ